MQCHSPKAEEVAECERKMRGRGRQEEGEDERKTRISYVAFIYIPSPPNTSLSEPDREKGTERFTETKPKVMKNG